MYDKKASIMTKGLAIICMVVLHLFCRTGENTFGTPLIWVTQEIPLVYYFGFFAEICVPIYSICAGYAQYLYFEKGKASLKNSAIKILKLMINYWIVLFVFCGLGLIFNNDRIPGSLFDFIKSVFLLHSYNGAWWYLNTYIILLLIPAGILFFTVKKTKNPAWAFSICFGIDIVWYLLDKFKFLPELYKTESVFSFVGVEAFNLINVLPYFWIGAFICKFKAIDYMKEKLDKIIPLKYQNILLAITFVVLFIVAIIVHKAVLMGFVAVATFFIFNLIKKSKFVESTFMFLGKHSTNIWLTHMFFYQVLFVNLVQVAKYPLFMLLFMILLCVITSYFIIGIQKLIFKIHNHFKGVKLCQR